MKRALITGITGQDGFYLAKFLASKGYKVYGLYRNTSSDIFDKLGSIKEKINLVQGDITDSFSILRSIRDIQPHEVYNLAAQSFIPASWAQPISTGDTNALGVTRILEAIRQINPKIRFYQASSNEMFGKFHEDQQTEETPFHPRNPYAVAKIYGYWITINYRESFGMYAANGIMFNHESPLRGKQFVTRKISHSVAKIKLGMQNHIELGNLNAERDWGFTGDYVEAMWLMLQQEKPDDYVIATGQSHSVRAFTEEAFNAAGMDVKWEGSGLNEVGKYNGKVVVKINKEFYRSIDTNKFIGDPSKAKEKLGWNPKTSFKELVKIMVESDINLLSGRK